MDHKIQKERTQGGAPEIRLEYDLKQRVLDRVNQAFETMPWPPKDTTSTSIPSSSASVSPSSRPPSRPHMYCVLHRWFPCDGAPFDGRVGDLVFCDATARRWLVVECYPGALILIYEFTL
jgi:hypothetical protein